MAFAFPTASVVGELYSYGGTTWEWDGTVWNVQPSFGDIRVSVAAANEIDTMTGDLVLDSATGETNIDDNLTVQGTTTMVGDAAMSANAVVTGTLDVTGDTTMGNATVGTDLAVTGLSTLTGDVTTVGNVTVGTDLTVTGLSTLTGDVMMGANATVTGNLNVLGTTTTVNSTTTTIADPVMTLGGDAPMAADDSLDKGIDFHWHDGAAAKLGFFGWDRSANAFTFIADATNAAEVFSGTAGDVIFGNMTGVDGTFSNNLTVTGATTSNNVTAQNVQLAVADANTINTVTGDLKLAAASSVLSLEGATTNVTGGLVVSGATTMNNLAIHGANVVPNADGTHDLGSAAATWANVYVGTSIELSGIPLTVTGNDLYVDGVKVGAQATVDTTAPANPDEGTFWLDRNTGNLYIWVVDSGTGIGNWIQPL
jgi:hypothetical protein